MLKFIAPLLIHIVLIPALCFSQEKSDPVVINKKVEVVEYKYKYVFIELITSFHYSLSYPFITTGSTTENQQFFEQGRNVRLGYDIGFSQSVKAGNWAMTAGLIYHQYNEFFSYNEYLTRQLTVQNQDGSLQTITVAVGDPVAYSRNNRLGYLKIPVGVEFYPGNFKNKLGIGLQFNYHYLLSADYMTKYSTIQQAGFVALGDFNTSCFSLSGNLLYRIKIFKNLSLTFEPYFNYGLNNLSDQKDLTFGMNEIGLSTVLNLSY
jgi:hypothetical protein